MIVACILFCVGLAALVYQLATGMAIAPKETIKRSEYPDIYWFVMVIEGMVVMLHGVAIFLHWRGIM